MTKHAPNKDAERLLAMSEKVGQVAQSLAQLALEGTGSRQQGSRGGEEPLSSETVDWLIRARQARLRYLPAGVFGEPVWDIMLYLLHAEITGRPVSVSSAQLATELPERVAARWLDAMAQYGLVAIRNGPDDSEQMVELTPEASNALRRYFREVIDHR